MLEVQIERIRRSMLIDEVIVATTIKPEDDAIAELADRLGIGCFRGSEGDVLGRVAATLKYFSVDVNVDMCGDCPLPDPTIIDAVIGLYLKHQQVYDYVDNAIKTTFPPGLEVIVYPSRVLHDVDSILTKAEDREHVAVNIRRMGDRYRTLNVEAPSWYRYPDLYLEVDTIEDFKVVNAIYESLYPSNPYFLLSHIIEFMRLNPALAEYNRDVPRLWKQFRHKG